jgi:hypothetical protein
MVPADRPDFASPPIAEHWSSRLFPEMDQAGDDQRLDFLNEGPDEDEPLTFGVNNALGRHEDTTSLGRVAGGCSQVDPGFGELWSSSGSLRLDRTGDDQRLASLNKKPDGDMPPILSVDNALGIGPQYPLVKNEDTTFLGRLGGRYSQVHPGLSDEQRISEVLLGCQFEHRLSRRNKVVSAVEYVRDPADLGSHRVRTQAAWEVLLDPEENLSLRTGVLESSNYAPNGEQAKSLNYNLNLIWKF